MYKILPCLLLSFATVQFGTCFTENPTLTREALTRYNDVMSKSKRGVTPTLDDLKSLTSYIVRQTMLQGLAVEERIRSDGGSGIKQIRQTSKGTKSYYASTFIGQRVCSIHEHSNHYNTVGMGEFIGVLNGVEFRTRHNDYEIVMPHSTSAVYHATEPITYPEVPQSVKDKTTPDAQIAEMREYFKAWAQDDTSIRDYTDYFKPVLCYMEGSWTVADEESIEESFDSDRHHLDATSWLDLQEKVRFSAYTGSKDLLENFAYLPTTILRLENGTLVLAQWNYRILCHPLSRNIQPSRLTMVDDLATRLWHKRTVEQQKLSRGARYKLNLADSSVPQDKVQNYDLLDELMQEIPGTDNYQGDLTDDSYGSTVLHYKTGELLNVARFHRWFKTKDNDAMGSPLQHRAFSDPNLFMAMTTQEHVPALTMEWCDENDVCANISQRWTYAVPMEMIYLTPLQNWNPYGIEYKGDAKSDLGKTVVADGRDGGSDAAKAYDGINSKKFYMTPASFFGEDDVSTDAADTAEFDVHVLGSDGLPKAVVASGTRIKLPNIPDVGEVRLRYPIMPTHQDDSAAWKVVDALKDIILNPMSQQDMYYEKFPMSTTDEPPTPPLNHTLWYMTSAAHAQYEEHVHYVPITVEQVLQILQGNTVTVQTTESWEHTHELQLTTRSNGHFSMAKCDGQIKCFDLHDRFVKPAF